MKILVASYSTERLGGTEAYVELIWPELRHAGHEVALLFCRSSKEGRSQVDADRVDGLRRWVLHERGASRVLEQVGEFRPDVVFSQGLDSISIEEEFVRSYPVLYFAHSYVGACISGSKCHRLPRYEPCQRTLGPGCLLHYYPRRCGGLNPVVALRQYSLQRRRFEMLRHCRGVIVASSYMRDEYLRHGLPEARVHHLPFPAPRVMDGASPIAERPRSGKVLLMGRLTKLKGGRMLPPALAQAASRLGRTLSLVVVGAGPELESMRRSAARAGVAFDYRGWIDPASRSSLLQEMELLAVPSLWPEPYGMTGQEAGLEGVPSVGYATGGIPEWLIPGETGESAPANPPTVDGLADAIVRALRDAAHYEKLSRGARAFAARPAMQHHLDALLPVLESSVRG